jgi:hypothetical protein
MKRCLIMIGCALLAASAALAQEKKDAPPPKPGDNGPSLEATMKFIQDKLKAKLTRWDDITADPGNCQLAFARSGKWAGNDWEDETLTFSLREVEKIEVTPPEESSAFFDLRVLMTTEKSVHVRHFKNGKPRPKADTDSGQWSSAFDEDLANRLAKAMLHAVELCGGGSKPEPF